MLITITLSLCSAGALGAPSQSPDFSLSPVSDFLWRSVQDVQYSGGSIYVLLANGIHVYDPGVDFLSPQLIARYRLDDRYEELHMGDSIAMVLSQSGAISWVDLSQPGGEQPEEAMPIADTVYDYASHESIGYVACGFEGLKVIDLSDLSDAKVESTYTEGVHVVAVAVSDKYLYAVDDYNGLIAYDIESPLVPVFAGELLFTQPLRDIAVQENRLYLAYGDSGVVMYDLDYPLGLTKRMVFRTDSRPVSVDAGGDLVGAVDIFGNIYLFGIDSTEARVVFEEHEIDDRFDFTTRNERDYLFLPDERGGLEIFSVDKGIEPIGLWCYPGSSLIESVALVGDLVMVTGAEDDMTVWRARSDSVPELITTYGDETDRIGAMQVYVTALDSLVFVTEDDLEMDFSWISLVDVRRPHKILDLRGNFLAYSSRVTGIEAEYNDSGYIDLTTFGKDGTSLFTGVKDGDPPDDWYVVLEVTNVPASFAQTAVERHGGYLYTYHSKGRGKIYDATNIGMQNELEEVGEFDAGGGTYCIEIVDSVCYLGGGYGLAIRQMNDYLIGPEIGSVGTEFRFVDLKFNWSDSIMFAALGDDGFAVYDVSDIIDPQLLTRVDTPGYAELVFATDSRLAVADRYSLALFEYSTGNNDVVLPDRFDLAQNYPNPFNIATKIEFSIPGDVGSRYRVRLEVINILGQIVRTITDGDLSTGFYTYSWDGTDQSGREVSSGVYFYRLLVDGTPTTKKMVLLK